MSNARYFALVAAAIIAASGTPATGSAMAQKGAGPAPGAPEIHAAAVAQAGGKDCRAKDGQSLANEI